MVKTRSMVKRMIVIFGDLVCWKSMFSPTNCISFILNMQEFLCANPPFLQPSYPLDYPTVTIPISHRSYLRNLNLIPIQHVHHSFHHSLPMHTFPIFPMGMQPTCMAPSVHIMMRVQKELRDTKRRRRCAEHLFERKPERRKLKLSYIPLQH